MSRVAEEKKIKLFHTSIDHIIIHTRIFIFVIEITTFLIKNKTESNILLYN